VRPLEDWLRETVVPAYDALKADLSRAVSATHVHSALSKAHQKALAKKRSCPIPSSLHRRQKSTPVRSN